MAPKQTQHDTMGHFALERISVFSGPPGSFGGQSVLELAQEPLDFYERTDKEVSMSQVDHCRTRLILLFRLGTGFPERTTPATTRKSRISWSFAAVWPAPSRGECRSLRRYGRNWSRGPSSWAQAGRNKLG